MRFISFVIFLGLISFKPVKAQGPNAVTINATGNSSNYLNITYEWSFGEMTLVESMLDLNYSLTNGFLQPLKTLPADILNGFNIIPTNILSINGDGVNDVWLIDYLDQYRENEVTLYNRLGEVVFHSLNYQNDWAGYLGSKPLPEDTYFYIIKLKKGDIIGFKKGYLSVIR
jgi:gliding motility-associated-like protein